MRSGILPLTLWGIAIVGIAVLGTAVFGLDLLPTLLLAGAGASAVAWGLAAGVADRRRPHETDRDAPEVVLRGSAATSVVVAGAASMLIGAAAVGPAFFWPGTGLVALGLGGLVRERLAGRRLLREGRR